MAFYKIKVNLQKYSFDKLTDLEKCIYLSKNYTKIYHLSKTIKQQWSDIYHINIIDWYDIRYYITIIILSISLIFTKIITFLFCLCKVLSSHHVHVTFESFVWGTFTRKFRYGCLPLVILFYGHKSSLYRHLINLV